MDVPATVREVRRSLGVSQRELAVRLGTAPSTVAAWESGRRAPSVQVLAAILEQGGRVLVADVAPEDSRAELRQHLRLSLTSRLRLALGERLSPYVGAKGDAWRGLLALGRLGKVVLQPPVATGVWIPVAPSNAVTVTVHRPRCELPDVPAVVARVDSDEPAPSLVPVTVEGPVRVWVLPPAELLVRERTELRQAAALLSAAHGRDRAGRRPPAHRDPDEWLERARMLVSKKAVDLELPVPELGRAWRLAAPVSLAQAAWTRPTLF